VTEEARPVDIPVHALPAPEGPFVLADPKEMGIPVFSKPIVAPKMILSNFPKVGDCDVTLIVGIDNYR